MYINEKKVQGALARLAQLNGANRYSFEAYDKPNHSLRGRAETVKRYRLLGPNGTTIQEDLGLRELYFWAQGAFDIWANGFIAGRQFAAARHDTNPPGTALQAAPLPEGFTVACATPEGMEDAPACTVSASVREGELATV